MAKRGRVLFDYTAEAENELDLNLGDIVTILEEDESGWSKGEVDGKSGWFPTSYYESTYVASETSNQEKEQASDQSSDAVQQRQSKSVERLKQRYDELMSTERTVSTNLTELLSKLDAIKEDGRWMLDTENLKTLNRTTDIIFRLRALHETLASLLQCGEGEVPLINPGLAKCEAEMIELHANYQFHSSCVIFILQKKAGGKVVGDKAVGTLQKEQGTLGAALWELQVDPIPDPASATSAVQAMLALRGALHCAPRLGRQSAPTIAPAADGTRPPSSRARAPPLMWLRQASLAAATAIARARARSGPP
jgi:hypothetical protein